jgi:hypothetical protein
MFSVDLENDISQGYKFIIPVFEYQVQKVWALLQAVFPKLMPPPFSFISEIDNVEKYPLSGALGALHQVLKGQYGM